MAVKRGRPATGQTKVRSLRMGRVWDEALEVAQARGERLTAVIERALRRYIAAHKQRQDRED